MKKLSKDEAKELQALRERYSEDIRGRMSVRDGVRRFVGGWGPALLLAGAAFYIPGSGLVENAFGFGEVLGWAGLFGGKVLAGLGIAFGARDAVVGVLEHGQEEDRKLLAEQTSHELEDEV